MELTLQSLRDFLMQERRGEALSVAPYPEWDEGEEHYFCTPLGARIIGSAGVDGIHFCQISGDDRVFAVSPMNGEGEYVHPVARDLTDFCRLILACGSTAAIEQAWQWSREQFAEFLRDDLPDDAGKKALADLAERFSLTPMEDPYGYMEKVREGFSEDSLAFPSDEEENPTAEADLGESSPDLHGELRFPECFSKPTPFRWNGTECFVLGYGWIDDWWVADVAFRWTEEMIEQVLKENTRNPFEVSIDLKPATGHLDVQEGSGAGYFPGHTQSDYEEESLQKTEEILRHYGLDTDKCWEIRRCCFGWKPDFSGPVTLTITHEDYWKEMAQFTVTASGETFTLPSPGGGELTLTVQELEPESIPDTFQEGGPTQLLAMTYTLTPDPGKKNGRRQVMLRDTAPDDPYRGCDGPTVACIGVIGRARSAACLGAVDTACSSLHFTCPEQVTWSYQINYRDSETFTFTCPV